jgi:hypothetical protein
VRNAAGAAGVPEEFRGEQQAMDFMAFMDSGWWLVAGGNGKSAQCFQPSSTRSRDGDYKVSGDGLQTGLFF